MTVLIVVSIVLALVVINGIYVAAEFAIVGVSRASLDADAESGHAIARRARFILDNPRQQDRYIAATQLGVTFASLGLGMYGEQKLASGLEVRLEPYLADVSLVTAHAIAFVVAIAVMTFLHVVLGEMVPKSLALANPRRAVLLTAPIALTTRFLLLPLVVLLEFLGNRVMRLFGVDRSSAHGHHTAEDLQHIVQTSHREGQLTSEAGKALTEMFDFSALKAEDVMVPRVSMHALELGADPSEIGKVLKEGQHTRYPVYEDDLDEIVGMVHIRDLLRLLRNWEGLGSDVVRPIPFVPETMSVERVLGVMRRDKTHAVIAMDEQGGTAGLLTIKDLFEEVVGTIEEGDVDIEGRVEAFRDLAGRLNVLGTLRLDELAEVLAVEMPDIIVDPHASHAEDGSPRPEPLPETDAETVSGLVLLQLGRPAQVGDTVMHGPVRLVVIEIEGRGVKACLVERS